MLNENTIEILGIWGELHNSGFNRVQFEAIKNGADTLNLVLAGKPTDHPAWIPWYVSGSESYAAHWRLPFRLSRPETRYFYAACNSSVRRFPYRTVQWRYASATA